MGEEILPLQQACYREHNSLVFLPRCTLSLLSVCTAYLLLQSLTILVGPEINWNKSKMKYELKCRGGGGGGGQQQWKSGPELRQECCEGQWIAWWQSYRAHRLWVVRRTSRPSGVDFSHSLSPLLLPPNKHSMPTAPHSLKDQRSHPIFVHKTDEPMGWSST